MSVMEIRPGATGLTRLGNGDRDACLAYLARDPVATVFLRGLVLDHGIAGPRARGAFYGFRDGPGLRGVLFFGAGRLLVMHAGEPDVCEAFAALAVGLQAPKLIVGDRAAIDPFWARFHVAAPPVRWVRLNRVYEVRAETLRAPEASGATPSLRTATPEDLDLEVTSSIAMIREDMGEAPGDLSRYRASVLERIRKGRSFLWCDDGPPRRLLFKANLSAVTPEAAQVEGVFTPPDRRGQGYATRGLHELCRRTLEQTRTVCLYVNDANAHALRLYERVGFKHTRYFRSILLEG
jgi:hypothetical protein